MLFYAIILSFVSTLLADRQLTNTYNPQCGDLCKNTTDPVHLIYSLAKGKDDSMHYVFSAGGELGAPSLLILHSNSSTEQLKFDWNKLLSEDRKDHFSGISVENEKVLDDVAIIVFNRLFAFNDTKDTANITKSEDRKIKMPMNCLIWEPSFSQSDDTFSFNAMSSNNESDHCSSSDLNPFKANGTLQLNITFSGKEFRPSMVPKLQFTGNNTQFQIMLRDLTTDFKNQRYALEMAYLTLKNHPAIHLGTDKSIDDEFTPGTFTMTSWHSGEQNYAQWKPMVYTEQSRNRRTSTTVEDSIAVKIDRVDLDAVKSGLAYVWFGDKLSDTTSVVSSGLNVTFGFPADKFYNLQHNYIWTGSAGYGRYPMDSLSSILLIVMIVGLGIPVILIIVAFGFVCYRKAKEGSRVNRKRTLSVIADGSAENDPLMAEAERERAAGYQAIN